jgi:hypothetical protein
MSLYIVSICVPEKGWLFPKVFDEDHLEEMDSLIMCHKVLGHTVTTSVITGDMVDALREYFK